MKKLDTTISKETYDGSEPAVRACYKPDGENFTLDLTPPAYDTGIKHADLLRCGMLRDAAAKALHEQVVKEAVTAAGLPGDKVADVLAGTRCTVAEDGAVSLIVWDPKFDSRRLSLRPEPSAIYMDWPEFAESLKPKPPVDTGPVRRMDDIKVATTKNGVEKVIRRDNEVFLNGEAASRMTGEQLMSIGRREQGAREGMSIQPQVRQSEKALSQMSGPELMAVSRGLLVPAKSKE